MYLDWSYIVLVLPAVIFAMVASARVNSVFNKYASRRCRSGITGAQAARRILDANGLHYVAIGKVSGELTDHFNPTDNTVYLSDSTHSAASVAAIGVAAHEAGHAVQHAKGYFPMKIRAAIIPATNFGSKLAMPLLILGIILSYPTLAFAGVILFSLSTLFQLVTLPVEFNASRRAIAALDEGARLGGEEMSAARKVLRAAALTYVGALAMSLLNLLRLILIANRSRRN